MTFYQAELEKQVVSMYRLTSVVFIRQHVFNDSEWLLIEVSSKRWSTEGTETL